MNRPETPRIACGPVSFTDLSASDLIGEIAGALGAPRLFTCLNAHALDLALREPRFLRLLNEGSFCFCDGFGIHLLCRLWGFGKPRHRNTPTDFLPDLLARLAAEGKTAYLLGDTSETAAAFAAWAEARHPGSVAGFHDGFFAFGSPEEAAIVAEIARLRPHAILLGMGMPRQEYWAEANAERLACQALVMIGASMAFLVGSRPRGPQWATDRGLEWLFRLFSEPAKLWSRYLVELPSVALRLGRYRTRG